MDLTSGQHDPHETRCCVLGAHPIPDDALRQRPDVHAEHHGGLGVGQGAGVQHRLRPSGLVDRRAFLRGLEHEQHRAGELGPQRRQDLRRGDDGGDMAVVSTGVGDGVGTARVVPVDDRRREVDPGALGDR